MRALRSPDPRWPDRSPSGRSTVPGWPSPAIRSCTGRSWRRRPRSRPGSCSTGPRTPRRPDGAGAATVPSPSPRSTCRRAGRSGRPTCTSSAGRWPSARRDALGTVAPGTVVASAIGAGEPFVPGRLGRPEGGPVAAVLAAGRRAVTVPVGDTPPPVEPGDRVDLVAGGLALDAAGRGPRCPGRPDAGTGRRRGRGRRGARGGGGRAGQRHRRGRGERRPAPDAVTVSGRRR